MKVKIGVARFPGTNCDRDVWQALAWAGASPEWLWHADHHDLSSLAGVVIPGGFSYGDYLRCGALAARSPVMEDVARAAKKGLPVLGICNGFQILCESGLLPGALLRNRQGRFVDAWVRLEVASARSPFGPSRFGDVVRLPVAHGEGRFFAEPETLERLQDHEQVWLRYLDDVNGSVASIAGVTNEQGNVAGLMPHPERAVADWMGGCDGLSFWRFIGA